MTDEQLALSAQKGSEQAFEELYTRYKPRVLAIARRFFLCGGETEDLVQEGMVGLYSAVMGYREEKAAFSAFAHSCIRNRILDAVKKSRSAKYAALNNFQPLVEVGEAIVGNSPEEELILREDKREFLAKISKVLSSFEFKALSMYTEGMTINEISEALNKSVKSVDNALTRSKRKLLKLITE